MVDVVSWLSAIYGAQAAVAESLMLQDIARLRPGGIIVVPSQQNEMAVAFLLPPGRETPSKCQSCGSREFRHHNHRMICTYCRSSQ